MPAAADAAKEYIWTLLRFGVPNCIENSLRRANIKSCALAGVIQRF